MIQLKTTVDQRKFLRNFAADREYNLHAPMQDMIDDLDSCIAHIERLEEALTFYADREFYFNSSGPCESMINTDFGERARRALEGK